MRHTMSPDRIIDRAGAISIFLASSSLAAGLIHAAVVPEHLEETWISGTFFIVVAAFQIAWAVPVALRPSRGVHSIGVLANAAMVGLWLVSRTIGLPVGPEPWVPEPAAALDITATLLELLLVLGSLALYRRRAQPGGAIGGHLS